MKSKKLCALLLFLPIAHATSHHQIDIIDERLGHRTLIFENINGDAVIEGDIIIGKVDELIGKGAVVIPRTNNTRWPHGIVPFEVHEDLPFLNKLAIYQAIDHWQQKTHLEFVELTSKNRYEYKDYISFIPAPGTTCSSHVGMQGGMQAIHLAPRCTTMNTVHEIGHAIGLWHEQSRSDRDLFIQIKWENIEPSHQHNFDKHLTNGKDVGPYNYDSLMHYGEYAFSKNGEKTIIPWQDGVNIGQRKQLSEGDIQAVLGMYPEA